MNAIALRRATSVLAVSPLVMLGLWYFGFGVLGTVLGMGLAGPPRNAREWILTVVFILGPVTGIAGMACGFIRFFQRAYDTAPMPVWTSLAVAAIGWWAGPGIWVMALSTGADHLEASPIFRGATILSLVLSGLWLAVTATAFARHGTSAVWALLGAPFILFWPAFWLLFGMTSFGPHAA